MKNKLPLMLSITVTSVVLDQVTKWWATRNLCVGCNDHHTFQAITSIPQPMTSYWADTFRFQYALNDGAWGGLFSNLPEPYKSLVLVGSVGLFLCGLAYYILRHTDSKWMVAALSLVLSGGIGNFIDRALNGFVVDFLNMGIGLSFRTNIFNIADVAVMAGAGMWIFYYLFMAPKEEDINEDRPIDTDDAVVADDLERAEHS